jgi:hypothetical protein
MNYIDNDPMDIDNDSMDIDNDSMDIVDVTESPPEQTQVLGPPPPSLVLRRYHISDMINIPFRNIRVISS